jgi:glucose dehydrogenase
MRRAPLIVAIVLALVGLVWLGQGTGLIGGSAMSGSSFWALVGVVLLVAAGAVVLREVRRPAR